MKIGKYDITLKNVWAWMQGNTRKVIEDIGPEVLQSPRHIQEQILWRQVIHNPQCSKATGCVACPCDIPEKFYSDKGCEGGCYPDVMDRDLWGKFKQVCARKEINIYADSKVDWDVILNDVKNMDDKSFSSLLWSLEDSVAQLGGCREGDILLHKFKIFNPDRIPLKINTVKPSCSCCRVVIPKPIETNEYGYLECIIDTTNKQVREHEIWLTVRYNEIKRLNLKIEFEVNE